MTFVFNASPVIVLAKAGLLDAIQLIGDLVQIPQAVVDEIQRVDDPNDPARLWFEGSSAPFALIATPSMPPFLVAWDLGLGESAVIAAASSIPGAVNARRSMFICCNARPQRNLFDTGRSMSRFLPLNPFRESVTSFHELATPTP